jgi:hypothetical protein
LSALKFERGPSVLWRCWPTVKTVGQCSEEPCVGANSVLSWASSFLVATRTRAQAR